MSVRNPNALAPDRVDESLNTLIEALGRLTAQLQQHDECGSSEILSATDLVDITGFKTPSRQIEWLTANKWQHVLTGANRPVVGRVYARLKLAGVKPSTTNAVAEPWSLDLSRIR